jgi:hypothetical protein
MAKDIPWILIIIALVAVGILWKVVPTFQTQAILHNGFNTAALCQADLDSMKSYAPYGYFTSCVLIDSTKNTCLNGCSSTADFTLTGKYNYEWGDEGYAAMSAVEKCRAACLGGGNQDPCTDTKCKQDNPDTCNYLGTMKLYNSHCNSVGSCEYTTETCSNGCSNGACGSGEITYKCNGNIIQKCVGTSCVTYSECGTNLKCVEGNPVCQSAYCTSNSDCSCFTSGGGTGGGGGCGGAGALYMMAVVPVCDNGNCKCTDTAASCPYPDGEISAGIIGEIVGTDKYKSTECVPATCTYVESKGVLAGLVGGYKELGCCEGSIKTPESGKSWLWGAYSIDQGKCTMVTGVCKYFTFAHGLLYDIAGADVAKHYCTITIALLAMILLPFLKGMMG